MFDYLQQFNKLPKDLRSKISEKEVMSKVSELEQKYQVDLAALIMKVMVKQVPYRNIALYLVGQKDLDEKKAEELTKKLKENVFKDVSDYLEGNKSKNLSHENKEDDIDKLEEVDKKEDPQELINQITKKEDHNIEIDKVTKDIIDKADVSLSSGYLHDRLHLVLRTYIKGVRDKIATRSALSRSGQEGGLSLDDASIDKVLKLADEYKKSQESKIEKPKPKVSEEAEKRDKLEALNDSYSLKDSLKFKEKEEANKAEKKKNEEESKKEDNKEDLSKNKKEKNKKEDLYKKLHIQREIAPLSPSTVVNEEKELSETYKKDKASEQDREDREDREKNEDIDREETEKVQDKSKQEFIQDNKENQKQKDEQRQVDDKKKSSEINNAKQKETSSGLKDLPQETKSSASGNLSQAPVSSGKKSMQDIKVNKRIMGPIDELRYFNVKNFRRLSPDPQEAFTKIKDKIDLLAKESYEKRIEGIQAWRENPLNKLYHQISIESLNQSKPISELIKQRQENNMDYLSKEELKALVFFNKSFMF